MAIQVTLTIKGLTISNAYLSIGFVTLSEDKSSITFPVYYRASSDEDVFLSEMYQCTYDIDGGNPFKQAYDYLLTLPAFSSGVEV